MASCSHKMACCSCSWLALSFFFNIVLALPCCVLIVVMCSRQRAQQTGSPKKNDDDDDVSDANLTNIKCKHESVQNFGNQYMKKTICKSCKAMMKYERLQ